jgi:hypothetical protein
VFADVICQFGFCAGEKKEKEHHISLPLHTIATMNGFFATLFAFIPPLLPLPPLSPSDVILLCHHPFPPCSKERPRTTTGMGGGMLHNPRPLSLVVITIISPIPSQGRHLGVPRHGLK